MLHPFPHEVGPGEPLVEARNVTCGYDGQAVLSDLSLRIMPGDFVGLLGPSGSGKTTLLRAILGAVELYQGQILVHGTPHHPKEAPAGIRTPARDHRLELSCYGGGGSVDGTHHGQSLPPLAQRPRQTPGLRDA